MITRKYFFITLLALTAAFTGSAQVFEEGGISTAASIRKVELYPNPTTDVLNIKFETPIAKRIKHSVHNIIGNAVEVESEVTDEYEFQLKLKDLPVGYYLLSLRDPETNVKSTYKFLKR